ncbi:hypothetical protein PISMIDRAFT_678542, partial [Pisolithus microcarpus 441]
AGQANCQQPILKPVKPIIKMTLAPFELQVASWIGPDGGKCTDRSQVRDYRSSASERILQRIHMSQAVIGETVGYLQC